MLAARLLPALLLVPVCAAGQEQGVALNARRLEADERGLLAEGAVRVELGQCQLSAQRLNLRWVPPCFVAEQACLVQSKLGLCAEQLHLAGDGALDAQGVRGVLCGCPGSHRLFGFAARRARIAARGARIHLSWPTLRVGKLPVLKLPYLALPLRPGVSGLLWPRLSYSERDGLRVEQGVYLATERTTERTADLLLAGGWVQHRGPSARVRLRVRGQSYGAALALRGVLEEEELRGRARGRVYGASSRWAAAVVGDFARDGRVLRDMETAVSRVFAPYLRSRAWTWSAWQAASVELAADLYQELEAPQRHVLPLLGRTSLTLGLLPVRVLGPLQVFGEAALDQSFAPLGQPARDEPAWLATRLSAMPGLGLALRAGPLRLSGAARYGLESMLAVEQPRRLAHVAAGHLEAAVPLARAYRAARHTVEPLLALSWGELLGSSLALPGGFQLLRGAVLQAGLRTQLHTRRSEERVRRALAASVRLELPLAERTEWLASGELELALLARSRAKLAATWDAARRELSNLSGELCWHGGFVQPCAGYARVRMSRVEELLGVDERPGWVSLPNLILPHELATDQAYGTLRLSWRSLGLGGHVAVDPWRGALSHASYWVDVALGCGCYRVSVAGASWAGQRWPDLVARFSFVGDVAGGCGSS